LKNKSRETALKNWDNGRRDDDLCMENGKRLGEEESARIRTRTRAEKKTLPTKKCDCGETKLVWEKGGASTSGKTAGVCRPGEIYARSAPPHQVMGGEVTKQPRNEWYQKLKKRTAFCSTGRKKGETQTGKAGGEKRANIGKPKESSPRGDVAPHS